MAYCLTRLITRVRRLVPATVLACQTDASKARCFFGTSAVDCVASTAVNVVAFVYTPEKESHTRRLPGAMTSWSYRYCAERDRICCT